MVVPDLSTERGRRAVLERMLTIREFDNEVGERFSDGEIPGFVHLYLGQEAVAVGATAALDDDYITSTHRGHGVCIAKGSTRRR
jgi:pyruvate dehydrogenase E1 component alpha subunit